MRKFLWFGLAVFAVAAIISIQSISADILTDPLDVIKPDYGPTEVQPYITKIINYTTTALEIVFVVMLLVGGAMYITAMGSDEAAGKARKVILYAIIGITIVSLSWLVGTWVLTRLKG